jgi:Flp pilus assembly protein TadG
MSDILGTAARAVQKKSDYDLSDDTAERIATAVLAAVTPLILERAAQVADEHFSPDDIECFAEKIATAIRALKDQP